MSALPPRPTCVPIFWSPRIPVETFGDDDPFLRIQRQHERIMAVVLEQLPHERVVVRKRAATCLGSVAVVVSESLLNRLALHLLQKIAESPSPDVVRTLIQVSTVDSSVLLR